MKDDLLLVSKVGPEFIHLLLHLLFKAKHMDEHLELPSSLVSFRGTPELMIARGHISPLSLSLLRE